MGCGGDEESAAEAPATVPELTVPESEPEEPVAPQPETETAPPAPVETAPPNTNGGTAAPEPQPETETTPETTPPADAPENDTPPPTDSPAERFEDFCNANPGACG